MMYANHHALTMNPYFMANPYANLTAQYYMQQDMNAGGEAGELNENGGIQGAQMEYKGDGFMNPFVHPGQESDCNEMQGTPNELLV